MPASPSVWTVMWALLATQMAGMAALLAIPVLAPAIAAETGLPAGLAGVHMSLCYLGALFSGPLTQGLIRRWGALRLCQGAIAGVAAGLALAALGQPWALALSAFLAGLGHGPITPAGSHLLAPRAPAHRRSLVFGLKQCGVPAGAMLVAALAPVLAANLGWRGAVLALAGAALGLALLLQPLRAALDADRAPAAGRLRPWREARESLAVLGDRGPVRALAIAACGYGVAQFCFSSFFVVWLVEVQGASLEAAGLQLALAQAGGVAGRVAWALTADRAGPARVLVALGLAMALGSAALAMAGPGWPELALAVVAVAMGASAIGWNGVLLGEVARVAPAGRVGGATAALGFAFAATMIVMPSAFSALVLATGGYAAGFAMCAAAALLGVAALRRLPAALPRP